MYNIYIFPKWHFVLAEIEKSSRADIANRILNFPSTLFHVTFLTRNREWSPTLQASSCVPVTVVIYRCLQPKLVQVCITEQRMGYHWQCAIRMFDINHVNASGTKRQWPKGFFSFFLLVPTLILFSFAESKEASHMFNPIESKATVRAFTLRKSCAL